MELTLTLRGDNRIHIGLCEEALAEASGDPARSVRMLGLKSGLHLRDLDARAALAAGRRGFEIAERGGDPSTLAVAIGRLGVAEAYAGEVNLGRLERGVEIEEQAALELEYDDSPRYSLARFLIRMGEVARARRLLEELDSRAAARGSENTRVMVLWPLSMLEWLVGRWPAALEYARAAYELGEQAQHGHGRTWVPRMKALIEADLGLIEQARASIDEGLEFALSALNPFAEVAALGVAGRLELAVGRLEPAAGYLRDLPGRLLVGGFNDPTSPIWADAIEALIEVGEVGQAGTYFKPYEMHTNKLGSPVAFAGVHRCRGLPLGAQGNLDAGVTTLERAAAAPEQHAYPLERARTLGALGALRRQARQRRAAREALEEAITIFEALGARLWGDRARAELARVSGRRGASDELTETERQVAVMAAEGMSNRQIASALFMGVSTVESHLSHVYRKLGIRSRAGLGARLSVAGDAEAKPVDAGAQS